MTCTRYFDYIAPSGKMHVSTLTSKSSVISHHFMKPNCLALKNSRYSGPEFKIILRGTWTILAALTLFPFHLPKAITGPSLCLVSQDSICPFINRATSKLILV